MAINVSEAIDSDTSEIVTVERRSGGYVDGIYQTSITSIFKTVASVQQPTPDELQKLSEGERNKDLRKFISKKALIVGSDRTGVVSDIVIFKGIRYKIIQLGDWQSYGHSTAIGAREK